MRRQATTSRSPLEAVFWGSAAVVGYAYVGYPLIALVRSLLSPKPLASGEYEPTLSLVIAAFNEEAVIGQKLDNILDVDYPAALLEVVVACDGCTDRTAEIVIQHPLRPTVLELPRVGKNEAVNAGVAASHGEVLVFSDADAQLEAAALRTITRPLSDPDVGGVAGDYRYTKGGAGSSAERSYWSFDRWVKRAQSRAGSVTSATGQLYAVRRSLWQRIPNGVADDSFTSVGVARAHRRLVFEPAARAYGPATEDAGTEFARKSRYIARGLRSVWLHREAMNPLTHGWYGVQLFSHKVVRRLVALPLVVLAVVSPALWRRGTLYRVATVSQACFHGMALVGAAPGSRKAPRRMRQLLGVAVYFDAVNVAVLRALVELLRGGRRDTWQPPRPVSAAP